jgi:negative regulator of sigma E activity
MTCTITLRRKHQAAYVCFALSCLTAAVQAGPLKPPRPRPFPAAARVRARQTVAPADMRARTLLRQMLQAEKTLAFSGDQITSLSHGGQIVTSEQRILRNGSHALRMEYLRPSLLAGEQIVDNGRLFYHYIPATNSLEAGPSRMETLTDRVPQVLNQNKRKALSVQWIGEDTVAGHACVVVEVAQPQINPSPKKRFWIDPVNGAQLRIDAYNAAGQLVSSSYYTAVIYNPPLAPGAFAPPVTPKDVHAAAPEAVGTSLTLPQAQAQAGFPIEQPTYLPAGFRMQLVSIQDFRRSKLVALRYVNGLNVLSLFETPLGPNAKVPPGPTRINHPRNGVSSLTINGLRIILVGNLAPAEMDRIVISLH